MKYRKKPVTIEAFRLGVDDFPKWAEDALSAGRLKINDEVDDLFLWVCTLEGKMRADLGTFIIKGVDGELYPCKAEIFYKTYERVDE